ncbi:MAG: response regulator transcription factor [Deltaproteobacteria bacterium]|nr:response regulator transcription factor [Deltaproteobacteria bacterium]
MRKILIADDHPIVRRGLKQLLTENGGDIFVGEAQTSQEALESIKKEDWDMVMLDIAMPGRGGLDVLKEIKQRCPGLPVLVLSMYPEEQYGLRALRIGASGYMTKEAAPENLVIAIGKILGGGIYVTPTLAEKLAFDLKRDDSRPLHEVLSDREHQVMCLIASGKTVSDIAEDLFLSVKTISSYRTRILGKMKMKNNAELTHYAIKNGLTH